MLSAVVFWRNDSLYTQMAAKNILKCAAILWAGHLEKGFITKVRKIASKITLPKIQLESIFKAEG